MKCTIVAAFLLLVIFGSSTIAAQTQVNPFHNEKKSSESIPTANFQKHSFITGDNAFYRMLSAYQKTFNDRMSILISDYKQKGSVTLLLAIVLFAAIYGFVHAMTPGHGKNIISAWILAAHRGLGKLITTAVIGMFFHVFTAIAMIYCIWFLIKGKISVQSPLFIRYFSITAFILILAIAAWNVVQIIRSLISHKKKGEHSHSHGLDSISAKTTWKECATVALSMGIIPCPVSSILVIFLLTKGLVWEGLVTGLFFSLGMSITLLLFSISIWIFRSLVNRMRHTRNALIFDTLFQFIGVLLLVLSAFVTVVPYI